jgi:hypothetical protein
VQRKHKARRQKVNILASIKAEKKMSFKHWRYRLLHWCFGEKAKTPEESNLPKFLYTHYCPLFHLTNLIAILFPLILLVKFVMALVIGIVKCATFILDAILAVPWHKIGEFYRKLFPPREPRAPREPTEEEKAAARAAQAAIKHKEERKRFLGKMLESASGYRLNNLDELLGEEAFDSFWHVHGRYYDILTREEAEAFYETRMAKIVATKKRVAERKEKMRQRMIFWTQFSEVFFRWTFNIFYICLAVFVGWLGIKFVPPMFFAVIDFFRWVFTFDMIPFLKVVGYVLLRVLIVGGALAIVVYGFVKFQLLRKCGSAIGTSLVAVSPPFVLLATWAALPFKWIAAAFNSTIEFIEMFYKENCPPIQIVSGEDEQIAAELGDE